MIALSPSRAGLPQCWISLLFVSRSRCLYHGSEDPGYPAWVRPSARPASGSPSPTLVPGQNLALSRPARLLAPRPTPRLRGLAPHRFVNVKATVPNCPNNKGKSQYCSAHRSALKRLLRSGVFFHEQHRAFRLIAIQSLQTAMHVVRILAPTTAQNLSSSQCRVQNVHRRINVSN